jgi:hypothetical protein
MAAVLEVAARVGLIAVRIGLGDRIDGGEAGQSE